MDRIYMINKIREKAEEQLEIVSNFIYWGFVLIL